MGGVTLGPNQGHGKGIIGQKGGKPSKRSEKLHNGRVGWQRILKCWSRPEWVSHRNAEGGKARNGWVGQKSGRRPCQYPYLLFKIRWTSVTSPKKGMRKKGKERKKTHTGKTRLTSSNKDVFLPKRFLISDGTGSVQTLGKAHARGRGGAKGAQCPSF